jgi:CheY-like chemotaxis protein
MSAERVILIADDDPSDVFFLRQALAESCPRAQIREVRDGQDAVDYLSGEGHYADRALFPLPTEVFLDVKMPRRTGLEVLKWMRDHENFRATRVTVLSGSQLAGDKQQAVLLSAEYMVKPVDYETLRQLVAAYFRDVI